MARERDYYAPIPSPDIPAPTLDQYLRSVGASRGGATGNATIPEPADLTYADSPLSLSTGAEITPAAPTVTNDVDSYAISPALPNSTIPAITLTADPQAGVLMPDNGALINYKPAEFVLFPTAALANIWIPAGTAPPNGWPVVLTSGIAGYFGLAAMTELDPSDPLQLLFHKFANAGFAVMSVGANSSGNASDPIASWFDLPGTGGDWEDMSKVLPDKDFLHAIQWVREQATYDLDTDRIYLHGVSAGATIALWIAFHPELAASSGSSHIQQSSAVAGVFAFNPLLSFLAYEDTWDVINAHFQSVANPGSDCTNLADADQTIRDQGSVARQILEPTSRAHAVPILIACDENVEYPDFRAESSGHPKARNLIGTPNVHDAWNSGMLRRMLRELGGVHDAETTLYVHEATEPNLSTIKPEVDGTFAGQLVTGVDAADFWDVAVAQGVAWAEAARPNPRGLQMNPRYGTIFGTPDTAQAATEHTVTATNAHGETTATISVEVT